MLIFKFEHPLESPEKFFKVLIHRSHPQRLWFNLYELQPGHQDFKNFPRWLYRAPKGLSCRKFPQDQNHQESLIKYRWLEFLIQLDWMRAWEFPCLMNSQLKLMLWSWRPYFENRCFRALSFASESLFCAWDSVKRQACFSRCGIGPKILHF